MDTQVNKAPQDATAPAGRHVTEPAIDPLRRVSNDLAAKRVVVAAERRDVIIDPLHRVFVPIERRDVNGNFRFQTRDKRRYVRDGQTGVIRRVNG